MQLEKYVEHLIAGDDEACLAGARAYATDLAGLHRLYVELVQPSQYQVGEMWEDGRISVAVEHLATATNSYVASTCYAPLARASSGGPKALIACVPDEMHQLGPRLLADLLECDGWDVAFYGASMPLRDLLEAIELREPAFVGLSSALVMHLGSVRRTVEAIKCELGSSAPPVVVGGNAFRGDAGLWRKVGADLYAPDASHAVEAVRGLRT